jgi:putative transposase
LQTLYLLFFIDLGTRRVHIAGVTTHPDHQWVTQRARQLFWKLKVEALPILYLIHDRDSKFTASFDYVWVCGVGSRGTSKAVN